MKTETNRVWIGLGGNVGDVKSAMASALDLLNLVDQITVEIVSSIYKTPPWGKTDQDWFLNCCAGLSTTMEPEALIEVMLQSELKLHRKRVERWGPRTIDLDILIFEGREVATDALTIPHPRMHERAFVLKPLLEIAGDIEVRNRSLSQWLAELDCSEMEVSSKPGWYGPVQSQS